MIISRQSGPLRLSSHPTPLRVCQLEMDYFIPRNSLVSIDHLSTRVFSLFAYDNRVSSQSLKMLREKYFKNISSRKEGGTRRRSIITFLPPIAIDSSINGSRIRHRRISLHRRFFLYSRPPLSVIKLRTLFLRWLFVPVPFPVVPAAGGGR